MEQRTLEVTLISAKDLKKVNLIGKMEVYAVVYISGSPQSGKQRTPVDKHGDHRPTWNYPMKLAVDAAAAEQNRLTLVVNLKSLSTFGDKDVGEVHVPVKELLDAKGSEKSQQFVSYQVRKPSGKPKGELSFSYKFGEKVAVAAAQERAGYASGNVGYAVNEPVTAYPAPVVGSSSAYPPPPYASAPPQAGGYYQYPPAQAAGYAYNQAPPPPPQAGYGYPPPPPAGYYPPQPGYAYPPVQQVQKPNRSGLGFGAGLLGGALGGLLIGDIVEHSAGCGGGGCGGGGCGGGGCGGF